MLNNEIETKFKPTLFNGLGLAQGRFNATTPINLSINTVDRGTGQDERVGNAHTMTGYYGKLFLTNDRATAGSNLMRMIIYMPKNSNANLSTLNPGFYAPLDKDQFTILQDKYITLGSSFNANDNQPTVKHFDIKRKLYNRVEYSGSASTSVQKGAIYIYGQ